MMRKLTEAMQAVYDRVMSDLRVCLPARIDSYDPVLRKATVTPLLKRSYLDGQSQDMPAITGVPVIMPCTARAGLDLPVATGDGCLLVFSDRSIDRWLYQGGSVEPDDRRKHDISDAIAIIGLKPFSQPEIDPNTTDVRLRHGLAKVTLNPDGRLDIGNSATTMLTIQEKLIDMLIEAVTATAIGPQPLSIGPQLALLKVELSLLKGSL